MNESPIAAACAAQFDSCNGHQRGAPRLKSVSAASHPAAQSATKVLPLLLTTAQAAALLGVSESTFQRMRLQPWFTAQPRVMSERFLRWPRAEIEALALNMPVGTIPQPEKLRNATKAARATKAAAVPA